MKAIIVSDLHIGSRYFSHENFEQFLQNIPQHYEFILNGDIIDNPYAKMKRFYAYLRKSVMLNAVNYAAENGFKAVTCGHTHYAEEQFVNGIRYINTGAWTEQPAYYVSVTETEMTLQKATDCSSLPKSAKNDKLLRVSLSLNHYP
jgi:UDP-2,3-diacylglucosamine pyrophosphatase LpxH